MCLAVLSTFAVAEAPAFSQTVVPGSTKKVCQLNGEIDRERGIPTVNQTETNYGLYGSGLGATFEFDGGMEVLFGDTVPDATFRGMDNLSFRDPNYNDSIAWTSTRDPSDCIRLQYMTGPTGAFASPVIHSNGEPVTLRNFEIPVAGIELRRAMYVFFATGRDDTAHYTKSVVGVSHDRGANFDYLYTFSPQKFTSLQIATTGWNGTPAVADSPVRDKALWVWGTPGGALYRQSNPYLAVMPLRNLPDGKGIRYYTGTDSKTGKPIFSRSESDAAELFQDDPPCMGELGIEWNPFIDRWLMLYNCHTAGGVLMRSAPNPWGPWSPAQSIFNLTTDGGYCHFIHRAWTADPASHCDNVSDPGREGTNGGGFWPVFVRPFTRGSHGETTIYYVLSTWNPYYVVLMKSRIESDQR